MTNEIDPKYYETTRHRTVKQPDFNPDTPRLGRRESEPHSKEIMYLMDVLETNFPNDRAFWDLHHFFVPHPGDETINIAFDVSYFKDLTVKEELRSYKAIDFDNRVPTMVINILSSSTWAVDLSDNLDTCKLLGIPLYIVFAPYHVATNRYKPPFARVYWLADDGTYEIHELRQVIVKEKNSGKSQSLSLAPEDCKDESLVIDTSQVVPFRVGMMERDKKVWGESIPAHRLILIHQSEPRILPTRLDLAQQRAEQERQRAEQERQRAEQLESQLKKYKEKFGELGPR